MKSAFSSLLAASLLAAPLIAAPSALVAGPQRDTQRLPIYFTENTASLTPEARSAIGEAAQLIRQKSARTLILVSASETGDRSLCQQRASAVADELIARGVAASKITVVAGELTAAISAAPPPFAGRTAEIIIEPEDNIGL